MTGTWRKSSYSTAEGQCAEVAALPGGGVGVRDSKNPQGGALRLPSATWRTFLDAIKAGKFDRLA